MLAKLDAWRLPWARLAALLVIYVAVTLGMEMDMEHLLQNDSSNSLVLEDHIEKKKTKGSRGANSMKSQNWQWVLDDGASKHGTAHDGTAILAGALWGTNSTRKLLVRGQLHGQGLRRRVVRGPQCGHGGLAITVCDGGMVVRGHGIDGDPMERQLTPQEYFEDACMGAAGFEDGKSHMALVSNRTGEGLATWNIPYYEIE